MTSNRRPHCLLLASTMLCLVILPSSSVLARTEPSQPNNSDNTDTKAGSDTTTEAQPEPSDEPKKTHGLFDPDYQYMLGDWGGVRTDLQELGIKFKIKLMNQFMVNMHGGKETKNGNDTAGSYEFNVYLDMNKLLNIEGATFWIRGKGTWGGDTSDFDKEKIGAFFKTNQDASSEEPLFVDKWHWQQFLFDKKVELRLGRQEPVKDLFDRSKIIGHEDKWFMNRALVRNATIPSKKGLSLFARWNFSKCAYVSAAVFDANAHDRQTNFNTAFHGPDEFRFYAELGCKPNIPSAHGKLKGHYRIGTWYDPTLKKQFLDTLGGLRADRFQSGDWGLYLGFDQMVWKENDNPKDKQGLSIAGRYGHANGEFHKVEDFWAVAVQYAGLIPNRDKDLVGFGVAQGIFGEEYRRVKTRADRETVYELYYAFQVSPWLTISPDLQFISNAGGNADDPDTFVGGLRFKMAL